MDNATVFIEGKEAPLFHDFELIKAVKRFTIDDFAYQEPINLVYRCKFCNKYLTTSQDKDEISKSIASHECCDIYTRDFLNA